MAEMVDFSVVELAAAWRCSSLFPAVPQLRGRGQARTCLLGDACRRLLTSIFKTYIGNSTQGAVCTSEHPVKGNIHQLEQAGSAWNPSREGLCSRVPLVFVSSPRSTKAGNGQHYCCMGVSSVGIGLKPIA